MFAVMMGISVEVALQVGGVSYTAKAAAGECNYSTESTIFEAPATMWAARQHEGNRNLNFTLWRLKKGGEQGGDMLTLFVTVGNTTHRVNTVKVGSHADTRGSGQATFERSGAGGIFTIDAIADTGAKISGRIVCSGFSKPEDNGN